jgi:predicted TIM-barrel fold metal-dependent hydrolase
MTMITTTRNSKLREIKKHVSTIDIHTHSCGIDQYNYQKPRLHMTQSLRDLELKEGFASVDWFLTSPMPSTTYYDTRNFKSIGLDQFPFQLSNQALLYECKFYGKKALPFLSIHPTKKVDEQIGLVSKACESDMVFGLKFHTLSTHTYPQDLCSSKFVSILEEYKLPLLIHSGEDKYSNPLDILKMSESCEDIRICISHAGFFNKELFENVDSYKNIFIDSSPFGVLCALMKMKQLRGEKIDINYSNPQKALEDLYKLIPDKLMWGTDEPFTSYTDKNGKMLVSGNIFQEKKILDSVVVKIKKKISYENPLRFLM